MRTVPKWVNKIHEADKSEFSSVHTLCFSPDGSQLVIGAGEKVMVYDPRDGALVQLLQAHKGMVHAVAYSGDGKKFASGSADKNVIIWTNKMEGVLKYSHSESIQCLSYNPVTYHLASCALSDFAFWSAEVKAVQKFKVPGRITSSAWSPNGQYLAIGLAIGAVSIRDKVGDEVQRVIRDHAVWAVGFHRTTLLVTDWGETLSFYNLQGQPTHKERIIGLAALSICSMDELVLVGGVGGWAALTAEGVSVVNTPHEWVWAIAPSPTLGTMAIGCQDGTVWCYQLVFSTVHGLYRSRYAYRENMTDVIVQHLTTGNKVRIKCHDRVQRIAIYKHRLAVQLPERVVVYEQGDADGMLYRVKEKLPQKLECSLLVATSDSLLLCQDTRLCTIGRGGRSWTVPAPIRYVKVTTLAQEEVLLLGLLNGEVWVVEPVRGNARVLLRTPGSVRCLDVSANRENLAVVDDASMCRVYSLATQRLLFTEEEVSSVSWNSWCSELMCLSGGGRLAVKAGGFPPASQPLHGSVVGFQGGRVFCLQSNAMQTINVPLSHAVHQYIQQNMFASAYAVACVGVTSLDWERLGAAALEQLSFEVARKSFQRSEQFTTLNLIDQLQERLASGENRTLILAEVMAHRGLVSEAVRLYKSVAREDKALDLYADLRMFNKAQELLPEGSSSQALAKRRAAWAKHASSPRSAAQMYLAAGDVASAAAALAAAGRSDMLIELARKLDKGASSPLRSVAAALVSAGEPAAACHVYRRLGEHRKVAQLVVAAGEWSRAFALAREHDECKRDVYLPYANKMAAENNFVEAQKAYHMAGETSRARRVFATLVDDAISQERFSDAAHLHCLVAAQCYEQNNWMEGTQHTTLAQIYLAYDAVHRSVHEPFTLAQPDALYNAAKFALALVGDEPPKGVSLFCLYLCLAKQAKALNAGHIARQMLDQIHSLLIPHKFQESVELLTVKCRASGVGGESSPALAALCWRCRRSPPAQPPRPPSALACTYCRHVAVHSQHTHEVLPLVRFIPGDGITEDEALELIERTPLPKEAIQNDSSADVLTIDVDDTDPFLDRLEEGEESEAVVCSRATLLQISPGSVISVPGANGRIFYRNMLPELPVTACPHCQQLFYLEDYEVQSSIKGHCPFCRHPREAATSTGEDSPTADDDDGW